MKTKACADYSGIAPIEHSIKASRQSARRHYGVHPYFTRRAPNVVRGYIEHYSRPGDRVLDPFGGSGVTAIEAILSGRHGIHNDINPLGNFIASEIADVSHPTTDYIREAFRAVDDDCGDLIRDIARLGERQVKSLLAAAPLPENIRLPKSADVERFYDLFTPRQLLALARLKQAIDGICDRAARGQLLLAWSATLAKLNKTFLSARGRAESRGGSSIFSIYRYKVAKQPVELPPWETFAERVGNVIAAKEEVLREKRFLESHGNIIGKFEAHQCDVITLPGRLDQVDYIFTDPPYGGHIAYLDLSTMWNHWLGLRLNGALRQREVIVGGELEKSEEEYLSLLRKSVRSCIEMLKDGRWFSIVFQHWNIAYFEAILETAEDSGAGFRAAVTQAGDTIWSMHKKKNPKRVLAGEMILSFCKDGRTRRRPAAAAEVPLEEFLESVISQMKLDNGSLHGEALFNRLIAEAWRKNSLQALKVSREDFLRLLERHGWRYDSKTHTWKRSAALPQARLPF
jgi:adenine-specific DNA methylase